MKKHMKEHSYIKARFRCEDCEFVGENEVTMEVHLVLAHSEYFECGLCELKVDSSEDLEIHLFTCEIYTCENCDFVGESLKEIKTHIVDNHGNEDFRDFLHLKMDRKNFTQVKVNSYSTDAI